MTSELEGLLADFQVQSEEFSASKKRAQEREERSRATAAAEIDAAKAESKVTARVASLCVMPSCKHGVTQRLLRLCVYV